MVVKSCGSGVVLALALAACAFAGIRRGASNTPELGLGATARTRATCSRALRPVRGLPQRRSVAPRSSDSSGEQPQQDEMNILTEKEIKARLKRAEDEAALLRQKLVGQIETQAEAKKKKRYEPEIINDNPLRRGGRQGNDMAGPSEAYFIKELGLDEQDQEEIDRVVRRRILLALGGSVVVGGLALIPTTDHKIPKEPASVFLVPVIRSQYLLDEIEYSIEKERWKREAEYVKQIIDKPNYFRKNILNAAQALPSDDAWRAANGRAIELIENIRNLDFQDYFQTETPNKDQAKFLLQGVQECKIKLQQFLDSFPSSELQKATAQAQATKPAVARDEFDY